jgi:DNA-binding transcriptional LysR family regulator
MIVKKRSEVDWQDVRVFLALARHGSLSGAARALSVNHATIARRLRSLEASVGGKLVERRPEGYLLTPDGTRTMQVASEMEAAAQTLGRAGKDDLPRGLVRVNAPPALAQGFLIGRLAALPSLYPGLDIDVATDLRVVSLERHQADIAVRLGRPLDGDFLARQIGVMAFGYYGTPEVCQGAEEREELPFVSFDEENADMPEALWLARHFPGARVSFRANNQFAQATAASAGAGLALLPHYIGRQQPALRLCRLAPAPPAREIWLLTRRQDRAHLPIRTVAEHIAASFAGESKLFEA